MVVISMRVLIYGFGPYRQFQNNVTESIVRMFPKRRGMNKIVFPVRFHRSQFIGAIEKNNPDVILGLGQCSRGRLLRIESTAVNKKRKSKSEKATAIVAHGAKELTTALNFSLRRQARSSKNAGDYVCNYSMYVILDFIRRRNLATRFGFVHIPHDYDPRKALRFLVKAIGEVETSARSKTF
jgi:pyrrolidone-carboxylate peptidase